MQITLLRKKPGEMLTALQQPEPSADNAMYLIADACSALSKYDAAEFVVGGFGEARWPVDVETDLATFLEQLPRAIAAVDASLPFSIEFYEQGVERVIHFEPSSDEYVARAESAVTALSIWDPSIPTERISRSAIQKMLRTALDTFLTLLHEGLPDLAKHPAIQRWLDSVDP